MWQPPSLTPGQRMNIEFVLALEKGIRSQSILLVAPSLANTDWLPYQESNLATKITCTCASRLYLDLPSPLGCFFFYVPFLPFVFNL